MSHFNTTGSRTINRFRVASTLTMAILALTQFLMQPDNLAVWSNPRLVALVVGGIAVVLGVIQTTMPSWSQAPAASAAVKESEMTPRG